MKTKFHTLKITQKEQLLVMDAARVIDNQLLQLFVGQNERSRGQWLEIESFLDRYMQEINSQAKKLLCLELASRIRNAVDFGEPSRVEDSKPAVVPEVKAERQGALF